MEAKYKAFEEYAWGSSQAWQTKLNNIYPIPEASKMQRIKKRFYKEHVDPDFDINYHPASAAG